MKRQHLFLSSGTLKLEGRLTVPSRNEAVAGVVICHPHPLYGGNMNNNVVHAIEKSLVRRGIACLCFNFRGVGQSEGVHDGARGEVDDALAAAVFMADRGEIDSARVGLAGYSFGGSIVLQAGLQSDKIRAVAAVSPPEVPDLGSAVWPGLLLCGSADNLVSASFLLKQKKKIAGSVEVIDGADHFWHGHEKVMADRVAFFFEQHLFEDGL